MQGVSITETLPGPWLWGYVTTLIVAPGILQAALALGQQYRVVANEYVKEEKGEGVWEKVEKVFHKVSGLWKVSEGLAKVSEKPAKKRKGQPKISWWREKYGKLNGERSEMTPQLVLEFVKEEWESAPSFRTLENWSDECKESVQDAVNA